MKRNYVPTEADRQTGAKIRDLRNRRGETLKQAVENSGFGRDASTLAATERGERRLTEIEATKLAAHYGTTADKIMVHHTPAAFRPAQLPAVHTEQEFLGNEPTPLFPLKPAVSPEAGLHLAAADFEARFAAAEDGIVAISRSNPMTPEQYRAEVWVPYLEARYAAEHKTA